jgi:hypothetical protein
MFLDRRGKHLLGFVDLHSDLRQISQLQGSAILVDKGLEIDAVKLEITFFDLETFLRKVERLRHQVGVRIILLIQFAGS